MGATDDFYGANLKLSGTLLSDLTLAASIIKQGGIVALPTETYYGLAVDPFNQEALAKLFAVKKRSTAKPILTLISHRKQLDQLTPMVPNQYWPLMEHFWPGPLTLIFEAKPEFPSLLTGDTGTVGVRIPSHPVAMSVAALADNPITATSANISGQIPARNAEEVKQQFGGVLDFIFESEDTTGVLCSTLVSMSDNKLSLIRDGAIPFEDVLKISGS